MIIFVLPVPVLAGDGAAEIAWPYAVVVANNPRESRHKMLPREGQHDKGTLMVKLR
jgi:hypothetical protein